MLNDKQLLTMRHSLSEADELFTVDLKKDHKVTRITSENDHIFSQLKKGKVEPRWTKTVDGKDMLSWVVYPVDFDPNKKYPTLLFCEGGPQSPVSRFRPEQEIPYPPLLRRRTAKPRQPILELPLEPANHGSQ